MLFFPFHVLFIHTGTKETRRFGSLVNVVQSEGRKNSFPTGLTREAKQPHLFMR